MAWPEIAFEGSAGHGVPLKSANTQVREFVICALALLYLAIDKARASDGRLAASLFALALAFLTNIAYVTAHHWFIVPLVAIPGLTILLLLLACKQFGVRVMLSLLLGVLLACVMIYILIPAVSDPNTWSVLIGISRPVFWSKSLQFIGEAPIFGHGTASIRSGICRDHPHHLPAAPRDGAARSIVPTAGTRCFAGQAVADTAGFPARDRWHLSRCV